MPKPGEMNALVRFDLRGTDANGDATGPWEAQFETWAKVDYLRGSESAVANRLQGMQPVTMVVHDEPRTQELTGAYRAVILEGRGVRPGVEINVKSAAPARDLGFIDVLGTSGGAPG